ncbi:MAG: hypothetical protein ABIQ99_08585 [Thermoflexales bacterium]
MPETHLRSHLDTLEGSGLIRQAAREPHPEYAFRHVLSQEAAYGSMLKQDRRGLHLDIGECLERMSTESPDELAPVLARHFDEAGDDVRALAYLLRAAEAAARRYATRETILLLDRAQVIALRGGSPGTVICDVAVRAGRLREMAGDYDAALATYDALASMAAERDDVAMKAQAILARAAVFCAPTTRFDGARGLRDAEEALRLAVASGDRAAESKAHWLILLVSKFSSQAQERGRAAGEASAAIARELGLKEQLAYTLNDIYVIYMTSGESQLGIDALREAESLWRSLGNMPLLADTLTNLGEQRWMGGLLRQGEDTLNEAVQIAVTTGNLWGQAYSKSVLVQILWETGRYGQAIALADEAKDLGKRAGFAISQIMAPCAKAGCLMELGAAALGAAVARSAEAEAIASVPLYLGFPTVTEAQCVIAMGDSEAAAEAMARARKVASPRDISAIPMALAEVEYAWLVGDDERVITVSIETEKVLAAFGCRVFNGLMRTRKSDAELRLGRLSEAEASARSAIALMDEMGARRGAWRAWAALASALKAQGRADEGVDALGRARQEIAFIAENAGSAELRASFLAMPDVRRIEAGEETGPRLAGG